MNSAGIYVPAEFACISRVRSRSGQERTHGYKRTFEISKLGNVFYDVTLPQVQVSVVPDGMSLTDNYVEMVTLHSLLEVYRTVAMERGYHVVHIVKAGTNNREYLCLEASGYDDKPALSEDLLCLIAGALSGGFSTSEYDVMDFFHEYRGKVYFSFGEDDRVSGDEETDLEPEPESEATSDYREEAAKIVYDAALAVEGFSYEVCYNAKGNLYIDLGTKVSDEDGGKVYSYRLVYDRPSKNGACELFVLYRSVEGSDNEAIVDMYAVETATGKVVASGKKAWSDVGTKEYREITGE